MTQWIEVLAVRKAPDCPALEHRKILSVVQAFPLRDGGGDRRITYKAPKLEFQVAWGMW